MDKRVSASVMVHVYRDEDVSVDEVMGIPTLRIGMNTVFLHERTALAVVERLHAVFLLTRAVGTGEVEK